MRTCRYPAPFPRPPSLEIYLTIKFEIFCTAQTELWYPISGAEILSLDFPLRPDFQKVPLVREFDQNEGIGYLRTWSSIKCLIQQLAPRKHDDELGFLICVRCHSSLPEALEVYRRRSGRDAHPLIDSIRLHSSGR
jgi:hypothetical protein